MLRAWRRTIRNGLVIQSALDRLERLGLVVAPFYLTRELPEALSAAGAESDALAFGWVGYGDLQALGDRPGGRYDLAAMQRMLDAGTRCFAARDDGRIAAFMWCDLERVRYRTLSFPLERDEVYFFNTLVLPAYRGRGIPVRLRRECFRALAAEGRARAWSITLRFKTPARRFKQQIGAHHAALFLSLGAGRGSRHWQLRRYEGP
jgi:GNAT superfamily N-acetyltransferase